MRIAVVNDDGFIESHLGKCRMFSILDINDDVVKAREDVVCQGEGHDYMLSLLSEHKVEALICGHIGRKAIEGLLEKGIDIYPFNQSSVDEAVENFIAGNLPKIVVVDEDDCCCHDHECGCHHEHGEDHCCCGHDHVD